MSFYQLTTIVPLVAVSFIPTTQLVLGETVSLTSTSPSSSIATISLISDDNNWIEESDGSYRSANGNLGDSLTVDMTINNNNCDGIETLEIVAYGGRVDGNVDNLFLISMENSGGEFEYFTYLNDWDNGVNSGDGSGTTGGVYIAPNCESSTLLSAGMDNNWINNILKQSTGLYQHRRDIAAGSTSNYELLTSEKIGRNTSPLTFIVVNDLINNQIRTKFSAPDLDANVECVYDKSFDSLSGNNYKVYLGSDQGTVKYDQFDVTTACEEACDYTHQCSARGDPHIRAFDGTYFHFQGTGYFDYIISCVNGDITLPFTISARHDQCNNIASCVNEVIVTLQDTDNTILSFPSYGEPTFKNTDNSGNNAVGSFSFADNNGDMVEYTVRQNAFEISFSFDSDSYHRALVKFSYIGKALLIETTDCLFGDYGICGLCGNINDNSNDDFLTCNDNTVIDNTNSATSYNDDNAWRNTHLFGESCCNENLDLSYIDTSDCGNCGDSCEPEKPDTDCMETAKSICEEYFDSYCNDCDNNNNDENLTEFIENCSYDTCVVEECILSVESGRSVTDLIKEGCLDTAIDDCASLQYINMINVY